MKNQYLYFKKIYSENKIPHSNFIGAIARQLGYKMSYKHFYEDEYIAIIKDVTKKDVIKISLVVSLSTFVGGLIMFILGSVPHLVEGILFGITLGIRLGIVSIILGSLLGVFLLLGIYKIFKKSIKITKTKRKFPKIAV